MRIRTATAVLLATGALLTGCSSGGSDKPAAAATITSSTTAPAAAAPSASSTTAGTDDKAALTRAVQAYTKAFFAQDAPTVFALLSVRCASVTSINEMQGVLTTSAAMYGTPKVRSTEVNALSGDLARVTVHYVKPPMEEKPQSWVREHGVWLFDGC